MKAIQKFRWTAFVQFENLALDGQRVILILNLGHAESYSSILLDGGVLSARYLSLVTLILSKELKVTVDGLSGNGGVKRTRDQYTNVVTAELTDTTFQHAALVHTANQEPHRGTECHVSVVEKNGSDRVFELKTIKANHDTTELPIKAHQTGIEL